MSIVKFPALAHHFVGKEAQAELEAEAIVKKLDKNADGKITRSEWLEFAVNDPTLVLIFNLD